MITVFRTIEGVTPIKVSRRLFVSGLYWQVLPNGQNHMQEARKIARQERERTGKSLDVVFLRRHVDVVQAGFVVRGGRARKGTVALAAVAADVLGPSFIAIFDLGAGRFAITATVDDAIVPDADQVVDEHEARTLLNQLWSTLAGNIGSGELVVYAPPGFWPDARAIELEDLLPGVKRSHRLRQRPALASKDPRAWIGWAIAAGIIAAGWIGWQAYQANVARQAAQQRAAALERLRGETGLTASELELMHPWTQMPGVGLFAQRCTQTINDLPLTQDGWVLLKAYCTATATQAQYARTEGRTVLGLTHAAQRWQPKPTVSFSGDGDMATLTWKSTMQAAGDEGLAPMSNRLNTFMAHWQARLVPFELKTTPSKFAPGYAPDSGGTHHPIPTPNWQTASWSIKATRRNPTALLEALPSDGIRLTQISVAFDSDGKLTWSLNGELYGQ